MNKLLIILMIQALVFSQFEVPLILSFKWEEATNGNNFLVAQLEKQEVNDFSSQDSSRNPQSFASLKFNLQSEISELENAAKNVQEKQQEKKEAQAMIRFIAKKPALFAGGMGRTMNHPAQGAALSFEIAKRAAASAQAKAEWLEKERTKIYLTSSNGVSIEAVSNPSDIKSHSELEKSSNAPLNSKVELPVSLIGSVKGYFSRTFTSDQNSLGFLTHVNVAELEQSKGRFFEGVQIRAKIADKHCRLAIRIWAKSVKAKVVELFCADKLDLNGENFIKIESDLYGKSEEQIREVRTSEKLIRI